MTCLVVVLTLPNHSPASSHPCSKTNLFQEDQISGMASMAEKLHWPTLFCALQLVLSLLALIIAYLTFRRR